MDRLVQDGRHGQHWLPAISADEACAAAESDRKAMVNTSCPSCKTKRAEPCAIQSFAQYGQAYLERYGDDSMRENDPSVEARACGAGVPERLRNTEGAWPEYSLNAVEKFAALENPSASAMEMMLNAE